jgi:hypothetical protein
MAQKNRQTNHLLRRTLVPLLIVALPIASMIAYILYHKHTQRLDALSVQTESKSASFGGDSWTFFRGNGALTGRAPGHLPEKLMLAWTFSTGDAVRSAPIVAAATVFVSSMDKHLYAVDLNTGKQLWKFTADDELEAL